MHGQEDPQHSVQFGHTQEQAAMLEHMEGECELLGGLHHPCIVQLFGMCFEQAPHYLCW